MKKPDRNAPCACGSGKKYKRCCYLKSLPRVGEEDSLRSELVHEVIAFSQKFYSEAIERAYGDFWGDFDPEEELDGSALQVAETSFWEWFIHDCRIEEEGYATPIELYERSGMALDPERIAVLERMRKTVVSLYEVEEVLPEEGLLLNDLILGGTYAVRERLGTRGLSKWDIFAARLIFVDGVHVISGGMHPYPRSAKRDLLEGLEKLYKRYRKNAPDDSRALFLKLVGYSFNRYWCMLVKTPFQPKLTNKDGEPFVFCKALFEMDDRIAAVEKLRSLDAMEEEEQGTFQWLGERTDDDSATVLGTVRMRGRSLALECNSRERIEAGKALLLERLDQAQGGHVSRSVPSHQGTPPLPPNNRKQNSTGSRAAASRQVHARALREVDRREDSCPRRQDAARMRKDTLGQEEGREPAQGD